MTRRAHWTVLGLVAAAAACSEIATPVRLDFYEWRLIVPSTTGAGIDSLTFPAPLFYHLLAFFSVARF